MRKSMCWQPVSEQEVADCHNKYAKAEKILKKICVFFIPPGGLWNRLVLIHLECVRRKSIGTINAVNRD